MPPPATTDELVQRLRRSGLVPVPEMDAFVAELPGGLAPQDVLDRMVADRMLTPFQADRLAVGKYKGFLLGGYVILDKIGSGGMGQVYLAEHANMRRLVAVKVMPAGIVAEDAVARERFLREARAAAVLNHPNIVRVFDLNREGGLPYLVMEYIDGLSLQALVTASGPVAPGAAADYARQVALGLHHAHEKGMVHRDIKPGNVLVDRHGVARLLDLGLVRNLQDIDTRLTSQFGGQSILGTADYLAPEQAIDSSKVDTRADVYSLGATLYFLLAGHPMFPEGRTAQKLMWQQWKDPPPIRELKPDVPDGLAEAVHKAVAKKPEDRYQTPQEMADALLPFAVGPAAPDPGLIPDPPTRRWSQRGGGEAATPARVPAARPRTPAAPVAAQATPMARLPDPVWGSGVRRAAEVSRPSRAVSVPAPKPAPPAFEKPTPLPPVVAPAAPVVSFENIHLPDADPAPVPVEPPPSRLPLVLAGLAAGVLAGVGLGLIVWLTR
jgi:serine/threonine protein kinase